MRYLVTARLKAGMERALLQAVREGTLGRGSIAGDEYLENMHAARRGADGLAQWVEVCFCAEPLEEERPYWEMYFELVAVRDAHRRGNCRHESRRELWACCDCDCTRRLEERLARTGESFLASLAAGDAQPGAQPEVA